MKHTHTLNTHTPQPGRRPPPPSARPGSAAGRRGGRGDDDEEEDEDTYKYSGLGARPMVCC